VSPWVAGFGTLEIGHCARKRSFVRVLDDGRVVWTGRRSYPTLEAALDDAEAGVAEWMRDQLGTKETG
jgi:hypothetical protein